jgi:hypothetical protein
MIKDVFKTILMKMTILNVKWYFGYSIINVVIMPT